MALGKELIRDEYRQELRDDNTYYLKKDLFLKFLCDDNNEYYSQFKKLVKSDFINDSLVLLTNMKIKDDGSILLFLHMKNDDGSYISKPLTQTSYHPLKNDMLDYELYSLKDNNELELYFSSEDEDSDSSEDEDEDKDSDKDSNEDNDDTDNDLDSHLDDVSL